MTPPKLMCASRICPLRDGCARHEYSGTTPGPNQKFASGPNREWEEAETAACSGFILAKDIE